MSETPASHGRFDELVARPSESLNVELKSWLDLSDPYSKAKLAKAALALRNRNGGFVLIGFDDKTLEPLAPPSGTDVVASFHVDVVQSIVSQFAFEKFEVTVGFGDRDGIKHPVIAIPEGVKTPVAAKTDLANPSDQKKFLIRRGDVYFRTLEANGTPSTAVARPEDWKDIVEICFDNREADVGRFLRRQLGTQGAQALLMTLQGDAGEPEKKRISLKEASLATLNDGYQHYLDAIGGRSLSDEEKTLIKGGAWSVGLCFEPTGESEVADEAFLSAVTSSNPRYTGWPVWLDSRGFRNAADHPYVLDNGWEALIVSAGDGWMASHCDFMRLEPKGRFYLRRTLQDDTTPEKVTPGKALDPLLMIYRVAEVIAVGLAIGKALQFDQAKTKLGFSFRWDGLRGRQLGTWADPMSVGMIGSSSASREDTLTTYAEISLDTAPQAIAPAVDAATRKLFAAFGGYQFRLDRIEDRVSALLSRQF